MKVQTKNFGISLYVKGDLASEKLILALPGKLDSKDYKHMRGLVDFFGEKGYLAISMDPPGTWDSEGGAAIYTLTNYTAAINEILDYFGKTTILVGHSMGGSAAMFALDNIHVKALIAIMSPYKFEHLIKKIEGSGSIRDLPNDPDNFKKYYLNSNFYRDAKSHDATHILRKIKKPKLFIYGTDDNTVTPELIKESFAVSSEPKQLVGVSFHHDYRNDVNVVAEVNDIVANFIESQAL